MSREKPQVVYRSDYRSPDYRIETADLEFELEDGEARVRTRLVIHRNPELVGDPPPLLLDGEDLELLEIRLDGEELAPHRYRVDAEALSVESPPPRFELETRVRIKPQENTALSGLYRSAGNFCTQCEAMGFRRITYFLDRPDVMARFTTSITADRKSCPVMLSNGNRVLEEDLGGGRHRVRWEDPHPKPSYLFALVAGDLRCHAGEFKTRGGRRVRLEIWVEAQNIDRCDHALQSLKRAMTWDEEKFGLEYDLDVYMVVAVNDFNMGAMENKGLNIFNSKYVLACPETATDDDYGDIERVVAHEYFHNWTGNRVTCRDWFQLTLKEGLTVFRDQQFGSDISSSAVTRIEEVKILRTAQFSEDAGPMSHPIRPESYISMDNFYTATVYNKGAEVIRMYHSLLGREGFRRGMDLYFERHDGEAVTCDDFRSAMADANGRDLSQFGLWYSRAGTPVVEAEGQFDSESGRYRLALRQSAAPDSAKGEEEPAPLQIPISIALFGSDGSELPLRLAGEGSGSAEGSRILELTRAEQEFVFVDLKEPPHVSLLRDFSAPVRLRFNRSREELAFLMGCDSDAFNRWDAGQALAGELLLELAAKSAAGDEMVLDHLYSGAFARILADPELNASLKSLALTLPSEKIVGQEMETIDPDALHRARQFMRARLAGVHLEEIREAYREHAGPGAYSNDRRSADRRRLKNTALAYWVAAGEEEAIEAAERQFETADNMTDAQAALTILVDTDSGARDRGLAAFYERWRSDPLVIDKWFAIQANSTRPDTVERVLELAKHPDFSIRNPNRLRSLVGTFSSANQVYFHRRDGAGYRFLADTVIELDPINPQLAARMVSLFNPWRRYDLHRQQFMRAELERIRDSGTPSKDVFEIVDRALAN